MIGAVELAAAELIPSDDVALEADDLRLLAEDELALELLNILLLKPVEAVTTLLSDALLALLDRATKELEVDCAAELASDAKLEVVEDKPINSLRINCARVRLQSLSHCPGLPMGMVCSMTLASCSSVLQLVQLFKLLSLSPTEPPCPWLPWQRAHCDA
jgi:hypothetical protein